MITLIWKKRMKKIFCLNFKNFLLVNEFCKLAKVLVTSEKNPKF